MARPTEVSGRRSERAGVFKRRIALFIAIMLLFIGIIAFAAWLFLLSQIYNFDPFAYPYHYPEEFEFVSVYYDSEGSWGRWEVYQIELVDSYAVLATSNGLHIVDISDPTSPTRVGTYEASWDRYLYEVDDMEIDGDYVYVTGYQFGLEIVDISNPAEPVGVSTFEYQSDFMIETSIVAVGDYAYFYTPMGEDEIEREPRLAWNGPRPLWQILDVSNPETPLLVEQVPDLGRPMAVVDNYIYAASDLRSEDKTIDVLQVIDISDGAKPTVITEQFLDYSGVDDIVIEDEMAYVSVGSGVDFVDISNPRSPEFIRTDLHYIGDFSSLDVEEDVVVGGAIYSLKTSISKGPESVTVDVEPFAKMDYDRLRKLLCDRDKFPIYRSELVPWWELCPNEYLSPGGYDVALSPDYVYVATGETGLMIFSVPSGDNR